jgi:5-methylcytosine-specific restriction endonuclease McrA
MPGEQTVEEIRRAIWERQNGTCIACPNLITWNGMHMHEKVPRSKGGEISLGNSEGRCYQCHLGEFGAHKNRLPKFSKSSITVGVDSDNKSDAK